MACGCQKNTDGVSAMALSISNTEGMMPEDVSYVDVTFVETVKVPYRLFIRAKDNVLFKNAQVPHLKKRYYTLLSRQQKMPSILVEWMQNDGRYKNWFESVEAIAVEEPEPEPAVEPVTEAQTVADTVPYLTWTRVNIESATKTDLLSYAAYNVIDLGDASTKAEIKAVILEWYDANIGV